MKTAMSPGWLVVLALAALGGCSGSDEAKTMRVWGDVSYNGAPIADGTIDFVSADGSPPAQAPIKEGHYDLPASAGPLAGKTYRVEISALKKTGKSMPNVMGDGAPTMEPLYNTIPKQYNTESTLSAPISPDGSKNQFDFALKGEVVPPPR
jgi:hypothetical protein